METLYKELGFVQPEYVKNPYGIRIYIGNKGKNDWCVVIPKELAKLRYNQYSFQHDYAVYLISETSALEIAREYTELARKYKHQNIILKGETK